MSICEKSNMGSGAIGSRCTIKENKKTYRFFGRWRRSYSSGAEGISFPLEREEAVERWAAGATT
jgi:hypothetical protein